MIAIEAIVKDLKLDLILTACFGESAGILLELATYVVIEGANSSATYSDYAYRHPSVLSQGLPVTDETIEACLSSLTDEAVKDFLAQWNDGQDRTARVYVTCDASQENAVAANRTVAETNDDTINSERPFDGIGLVMNHTNQVPLLVVPYPRSFKPLSQISFLVNEAKAYGYHHVGVMLDQAAFNENTIRDLDDHKLPFVVKLDRKGPFFNALVDEYRGTFETKRQARLGHDDVYGLTVTQKAFSENKTTRHVHLYGSAKRMVEDRLELENELDLKTALIERCRGQAVTFDARYSRWFDLEYDSESRLVSTKEKTTVTDKFFERCGYFAIVTSDDCTADEAYALYFGCDRPAMPLFAEKAFMSEESQYREEIHDEASKRVIDFIAFIIWQRMFTLLQDGNSKGHG